MLSLVLWKEKAQLISSPHKFYLSSLTSSQATKLSLFFFYHLFCAGMNTTCWSPEAQSLLLLPLSLLKLWVWFAPPTRRPRPANEEETGERRASFASSNWSRKRKKKIADQLLDWMRLNNETDRTLLEDLSEEQGRIPFEYLIYSFLPSLRLTFQLQSSYQPFLSNF